MCFVDTSGAAYADVCSYICSDTDIASYIAELDRSEQLPRAIMDSGNNKHHCLRSLSFFPSGVTWRTIRITGAHGPQDTRVGIGTAKFSIPCTDGTNTNWSFQSSIYNPNSPVNLLCMDLFHYADGDVAKRTGHKVDFLDETMRLRSGRQCKMTRHPQSKLYLVSISPTATAPTSVSPPAKRARTAYHNGTTVLFKHTNLRPLTTTAAIQRLSFPLEEYFNITLKNNMLRGTSSVRPAHTQASMLSVTMPGITAR